jgi:3-carboxy-cis,cis-muconate cycloisomerase
MAPRLIESLATTASLDEVFSDRSVLQSLLDFEVALARAEAELGIVPQSAASAIAAAARPDEFDLAEFAEGILRAGTAGIPLAKTLRERVRKMDPAAAAFVHSGATSQDAADTALVLLLKRTRQILAADLLRLEASLAKLSQDHSATLMLGRTLLQPAPPVTFGLKAAGWLGAVQRNRRRLESAFDDALVVQFGGASGTLASLGDKGPAVGRALASRLGLGCPDAPWHTHRDRLAGLVCACGILCGSLGKMARDISLLMQAEVGEAAEPGDGGRGGSSTMPHKRNPIASALALAAAHRVPGEIAAFLTAMVQEHERGVGGWQAEWPIVATVIQSTGLALASMAEAAEGLSIDADRMRSNLDATHGTVFAERAMMLLAPKMGREAAHKVMEEATRKCETEGKNLADVLSEMPDVSRHLSAEAIQQIDTAEQYLGAAAEFQNNLLSGPNPAAGTKEED